MNDELQALYQDVIIDHGRHPRNFHKIEPCGHQAEGVNPLCGDQLKVYVKIEADRIEDISFEGAGCAISMASASLMTEHLKGKSLAEAEFFFDAFCKMITDADDEGDGKLDKLLVLAGVKAYPMRVKCATLSWHTFKSALKGDSEKATTE